MRTEALSTATRAELERIVGPGHVLTEEDLVGAYAYDATGRFGALPAAVVRPADADEVAALLSVCSSAGLRVVAQGGNTGLAGGGVPQAGEVVLSLARLRHVAAVDGATRQIEVGAGVTLRDLQVAARDSGLEFPLDFPSRDTASVGGMIATNAAGPSAYRWGPMRAHVVGLDVILGNGDRVHRMGGIRKDNAGFDWPQLVIGSEGTLAVTVGARIALQPATERIAAVVPVPDLRAAIRVVHALESVAGTALEAVDYTDEPTERLVTSHLGRGAGDGQGRLYLRLLGDGDALEGLAAACATAEVDDDAAQVATDAAGRAALWATREAANESLRAQGPVHKYDIGLRRDRIVSFVDDLPAAALAVDPQARIFVYAHLGDGNLHVNVLAERDGDHALDDAVLGLVGRYGGSINAEHGVGLAKVAYLGNTRSVEEIALMRRLKDALDPAGTLGTGRVLPGV